MKRIILVALFSAITLVGCNATPGEVKHGFLMPPELEGCKVILINDGSTFLYVIKCDDKLYGTERIEEKIPLVQ